MDRVPDAPAVAGWLDWSVSGPCLSGVIFLDWGYRNLDPDHWNLGPLIASPIWTPGPRRIYLCLLTGPVCLVHSAVCCCFFTKHLWLEKKKKRMVNCLMCWRAFILTQCYEFETIYVIWTVYYFVLYQVSFSLWVMKFIAWLKRS